MKNPALRLPAPPRAVLFDLDGTLVDSEREVAGIMDEVLRARGRPLTQAERDFVIGHAWGEIYQNLLAGAPVPMDLPALEEAVLEARMARARQGGVAALPGAAAAVRRASAKVPCALVTGSSRQEALMVLDAMDLRPCFQVLCCAGDYPRGKPAPDPFLLGARLLGQDPARCLAVEDSTAGILAARAAGIFCIGVRAGNFSGQDQSAADLLLESLLQFDELWDWG